MNQLQRNASLVLEAAAASERLGSLEEALSQYEDGLVLLSTILTMDSAKLSPAAVEGLQTYMRQVEGKVASLRRRCAEQKRQPQPTPTAPPCDPHAVRTCVGTAGITHSLSGPSARPTSNSSTPCTTASADVPPLPELPAFHVSPSSRGDAKGKTPQSLLPQPSRAPTSSPTASSSAGATLPANLSTSVPKPGTGPGAKSPPAAPEKSKESATGAPLPTHSDPMPSAGPPLAPPSSASLAPRTSAVVLRAIDLAASLSKERKFKQAADVLQHAFDVGKAEGNNPRNFQSIERMIVELRRKYYEVCKPRFFQDNSPTPDEMNLLRRSGQLSTLILPIWDDVADGYAAENVYLPSKSDAWEDAFTPFVSPKQKAASCVLLRFPNAISRPQDVAVYRGADPRNIKQTVVGDCSLVCSLIVCSNFEKRFPQYSLITSVIFPQDENSKPQVSPKGKYCVKMFVNGMTRLVVIDDRIPVRREPSRNVLGVSSTSVAAPRVAEAPKDELGGGGGGGDTPAAYFVHEPLCTYSADCTEMWVSLIEKAFVKVCGGSYDFPGSTSSVDMFKLSGWLPDGFHFDDDDVDIDFQWRRLYHAHKRGAVVGTVSTPQNLSKEVEERLKLVPGHAYAILALEEVDGRRLVKVKNPWGAQSWEGILSLSDSRWTPELLATLGFSQEESDQGIFWISWADLCKFYKRCNLSWNPYLLFSSNATPRRPNRIACHVQYTHTGALVSSPQFHIEVRHLQRTARLHLVLSRHVLDLQEYAARVGDDKSCSSTPLITLHVFDVTESPSAAQVLRGRSASSLPCCPAVPRDGCVARRVTHGAELTGGEASSTIHRGVYRNMEAQTISFNCPPGNHDFVVALSQYEGTVGTSFPCSLLLHTDIALAADTPSAAGTKDGGNSPTSAVGGSGNTKEQIRMHQLPSLGSDAGEASSTASPSRRPNEGAEPALLPPLTKFVTAVRGGWKSGATCGGKNEAQTFVYNPQYHLVLSEPTHVAVRLVAPLNKEAVQVQLLRLRAPSLQDSSRGSTGGAAVVFPWAHRVDRITSRSCDFVLQSPVFLHGACVLDTALPQCLAFDATSTLRQVAPPSPPQTPPSPPPEPPAPPLSLTVQVPKASRSFVIAAATVTTPLYPLVLVAALAESLLASPEHSKVVAEGRAVDPSGAAAVTVTPNVCNAAVVLVLNTDELQRSPKVQEVLLQLYRLAKHTMSLYTASVTGAANMVVAAETQNAVAKVAAAITELCVQLDEDPAPLPALREARKAVLLSCDSVHKFLDWLLAASATPASSPVTASPGPEGGRKTSPAVLYGGPLHPLPSGDYTIVCSTWLKGCPSPFDLVVETFAPHTISEIPLEGAAPGWTSSTLQSQFRNVDVCAPPLDALRLLSQLRGPGAAGLPANHILFSLNSCAALTFAATRAHDACALFTCRLFTVEADPKQESSSVETCLALFHSTQNQAAPTASSLFELLVATPFSSSSSGINVAVSPHKQYRLLALSRTPSTQPFVLKCYSSVECSSRMLN